MLDSLATEFFGATKMLCALSHWEFQLHAFLWISLYFIEFLDWVGLSCNAQHSNRSGEGTEDQWSPFLTIPLLGCLDENDKAKVCYHSFLPLESLDVIYVLSDMLLDSGSHFDSFSKFFFRSISSTISPNWEAEYLSFEFCSSGSRIWQGKMPWWKGPGQIGQGQQN